MGGEDDERFEGVAGRASHAAAAVQDMSLSARQRAVRGESLPHVQDERLPHL